MIGHTLTQGFGISGGMAGTIPLVVRMGYGAGEELKDPLCIGNLATRPRFAFAVTSRERFAMQVSTTECK